MDLDQGGLVGHFDTVMLFSVIHHTRRMRENAARICRWRPRYRRVPNRREWSETRIGQGMGGDDHLGHPDKGALIDGLEHLFPGSNTTAQSAGPIGIDMFEFLKERS